MTKKMLDSWRNNSATTGPQLKNYRHNFFLNKDVSSEDMKKLKTIFKQAHADAKACLDAAGQENLSPFKSYSELIGYPEKLHMNNLRGYFGEVIAAVLVQIYGACGKYNWVVPVFRFRFHKVAHEQLETAYQTKIKPKRVPGITGEDCLALALDDDGILKDILFCEAKCTSGHSAKMISSAHKQISDGLTIPKSISQYLELLSYRNDAASKQFFNQLQLARFGNGSKPARSDSVIYVYAKGSKGLKPRISTAGPDSNYKGKRALEVFEVLLKDVDALIGKIYQKDTFK